MKLLNIQVLRGPNYWSNYRKKLIVLKIDLEKFEALPTNLIPNFNNELLTLMPSLSTHYCSEQLPGGLIKRLTEGTWLGHVIEHVALELQCLAGMSCGFGRTRSTDTIGIYHVIFAYEFEQAGIYAAEYAFKIINTLANAQQYHDLAENIKTLESLYEENKYGPSTKAIVNELEERKIPYTRLEHSLLLVGQGKYQKLISATETSFTSVIGVEIAGDKLLTKKILSENHVPVPRGEVLYSMADLERYLENDPYPIVIKPFNANHGRGVTCHISTHQAAIAAFQAAKAIAKKVIVERHVYGADFRFLVVDYKLVAVAKREPAKIIGDGKNTIEELIAIENNHPKRGTGHSNFLSTIKIDEVTLVILKQLNLNLKSILPANYVLYLKHAANISSGGTAEDVTDSVHTHNVILAERIARLIHLDICGIDIVTHRIEEPITDATGAVIEVNAAPGLRMHLAPTSGKQRNVAKPIINMLYPPDATTRIPIIAVTGTNGKTTVVRMLAYIAGAAGHSVGYTTTEGVYLNGNQIYKGDCTGPKSAQTILNDPIVDFAVLECARGGILRSGLGFDHCDISILTNISEDHLGLGDILDLDQLTRLKAVVPRSTKRKGFAILNADDDYVYPIKDDVRCQIALFALTKTKRIITHISAGGLASFIENDYLIISNGGEEINVGNINNIPLTLNGKALSMIKNILPVVLAAYISKFNLTVIKHAIFNFKPTSQLLPGRMNIYQFNGLTVLLDYAHNPEAYLALKKYIQDIKADKKIGIIAATGDRREIDIVNLGKYAAEMFDEIVIRHDDDGRGRTNEELTGLLKQGIQSVARRVKVTVISEEFQALCYTLNHAKPNTFIFYFPDHVEASIDFLNRLAVKHHEPEEIEA